MAAAVEAPKEAEWGLLKSREESSREVGNVIRVVFLVLCFRSHGWKLRESSIDRRRLLFQRPKGWLVQSAHGRHQESWNSLRRGRTTTEGEGEGAFPTESGVARANTTTSPTCSYKTSRGAWCLCQCFQTFTNILLRKCMFNDVNVEMLRRTRLFHELYQRYVWYWLKMKYISLWIIKSPTAGYVDWHLLVEYRQCMEMHICIIDKE